jgi:type VI secretion system protein ImpE
MNAVELVRGGDLAAALASLKQEVRGKPADARLRVFLFQLFCVTGEWERALAQLSTAASLDAGAIPMAQTYRVLIQCEVLRERVFAGQRVPTFMGDPAPWMSLQVEALRCLAAGAAEKAAELRGEAFDAAPASAGRLNDTAFEWVADTDPRLGPVLEVMVDGRYLWVPYSRLREVSLEPPADLRDQIWMPARFVWENGGDVVGFIPSRYPGSAAGEPAIALGRRTEWRDDPLWPTGLGQRMIATDAGETALLDLRRLMITGPA